MNRLICICKGIRENEIIKSISNSSSNLKVVQNTTGAATNCGKCIPAIDSIIEEFKHKKAAP